MDINPVKTNTAPVRAAGILLPVFSLPSPYGIGTFGKAAFDWVDFLHAAGQSYWQVLPLGPTSFGDSPYQSFSAFAGNPYFIDLDLLCEDGLLKTEECLAESWGQNAARIDYYALFKSRDKLLRKAFSRFKNFAGLGVFCSLHSFWLDDYALYMAVKTRMGLKSWIEWDEGVRMRVPDSLKVWKNLVKDDIIYHSFVQYIFFLQWQKLKDYANGKGILIIGDIPIYVSLDSADVWANSRWFLLDENKSPISVAGVPPDGFSDDGQLWGNPLYRWDALKQDGYSWWLERMDANLKVYDLLRIDHFRGFESYYSVPYGSRTAKTGEWKKGPGMDFISKINDALDCRGSIIAEDLGFLTDGVRELLKQSGYPGMKILQFAFDSREESDYMPHFYERDCVVFTGTHDNDTICGWFSDADTADIALACEYLGISDSREGCGAFIRAALGSVANLAIIPLQDYLELGSESRINIPSTLGGNNWRFRMSNDMLTPVLADKILRLTKLYSRSKPKGAL